MEAAQPTNLTWLSLAQSAVLIRRRSVGSNPPVRTIPGPLRTRWFGLQLTTLWKQPWDKRPRAVSSPPARGCAPSSRSPTRQRRRAQTTYSAGSTPAESTQRAKAQGVSDSLPVGCVWGRMLYSPERRRWFCTKPSRLRGLTDKALDYESSDCRFDSCRGH